ncbi:hypothetical protein GNI_180120 [Gregarina niphandrodes]|uniref:Transmembrane protein n=1 Tax=Gregarina niphandrodes TaxID=110365 RepID=A0A023AX09_GRENI|nr:hypothetical protein GNI_180120 [Gregarina niphandrodes]EZG43254.1 hypothetical protein GNI_180120 [Gregarina niphandrodes]|eukprot:XP_011133490.1 hypothetical protein GNI_180120 [Gregarina niphandrodes]
MGVEKMFVAVFWVCVAGLNPSASERLNAASRERVKFPVREVASWREDATRVLPRLAPAGNRTGALGAWWRAHRGALFARRRSRSVCDSIAGRSCAAVDDSRIEDFLWDAAGLRGPNLYTHRFTRLLDAQLGAHPLGSEPRGALSGVPLEVLSRWLMAAELPQLLAVPARTWALGMEPSRARTSGLARALAPAKRRRRYAVPRTSAEARGLRGEAPQDAAYDYWLRQFCAPGALCPACVRSPAAGNRTGDLEVGGVCHRVNDPEALDRLLDSESYALAPDKDPHPGVFGGSTVGRLLGPLPASLSGTLSLALETAAAPAADGRKPVTAVALKVGAESQALAPLPFRHFASRPRPPTGTARVGTARTETAKSGAARTVAAGGTETRPFRGLGRLLIRWLPEVEWLSEGKWLPSRFRTRRVPSERTAQRALEGARCDDETVLSMLNRDKRTWPPVVAALRIEPVLVDRWIHGKDFGTTRPRHGDLRRGPFSFKTWLRALTRQALGRPWLRPPPWLNVRQWLHSVTGRPAKAYGDKIQGDKIYGDKKSSGASTTEDTKVGSATSAEVDALSPRRLELYSSYLRLLSSEISPIELQVAAGDDWRWSYPQSLSGWLSAQSTENMPPGHVLSLKGAWHNAGLLSERGEIHLEPPMVVSEIGFSTMPEGLGEGGDDRPSRADMIMTGYTVHNVTEGEGQLYNCLHQHRRGGQCDNLNVAWRYALRGFESKLSQGQLITGSLFQRIDFIEISDKAGNRTSDPAESGRLDRAYMNNRRRGYIPSLLPSYAPLRLNYIDLNLPVPTYRIRYPVSTFHGANFQALLNEAVRHTDLYKVEPDVEANTVILEATDDPNSPVSFDPVSFDPVSFDPVSFTHDTSPTQDHPSPTRDPSPTEDPAQPNRRLHYYLHFYGTAPLRVRQNARSVGLDKGAPVTRGFQLPVAAQTAYDASWVLTVNRALAENRGRAFLTRDGAVVNSDLRPLRSAVRVVAVRNLPREAALVSAQQMHRRYLSTRYALHEFAKAELVQIPHNRIQLNKEERDSLLKQLKERLDERLGSSKGRDDAVVLGGEAEGKTESRAGDERKKESGAVGEGKTGREGKTGVEDGGASESSRLSEGRGSNEGENRGLSAGLLPTDDGPELPFPLQMDAGWVDTVSAENLAAQRASGQRTDSNAPVQGLGSADSVIDALRQVPVDGEIAAIVADTLGQVEASVMDLVRDVTIITVTEDPETGETVSRKVRLDLPSPTPRGDQESFSLEDNLFTPRDHDDEDEEDDHRTITFELAVLDEDGREVYQEIDIPIRLVSVQDHPEELQQYLQEEHDLGEEEAQRVAAEVLQVLDGYDLDQFDDLLDMLEEYNLNDDDLLF